MAMQEVMSRIVSAARVVLRLWDCGQLLYDVLQAAEAPA
jgi:hypothetical protein